MLHHYRESNDISELPEDLIVDYLVFCNFSEDKAE